MLYQNHITFLVKPKTEEEKLIAYVIKQYLDSLQKQDLKTLLTLLNENAQIHSLAAGDKVVSRNEFIEYLRGNKLLSSTRISLGDLRIEIKSEKEAEVSGYHQYYINSRKSRTRAISFRFEQNKGNWLITELNYYPL